MIFHIHFAERKAKKRNKHDFSCIFLSFAAIMRIQHDLSCSGTLQAPSVLPGGDLQGMVSDGFICQRLFGSLEELSSPARATLAAGMVLPCACAVLAARTVFPAHVPFWPQNGFTPCPRSTDGSSFTLRSYSGNNPPCPRSAGRRTGKPRPLPGLRKKAPRQ